MSQVEQRLAALGITLPVPAAPLANYVPFVITGNLLVTSGQLCFGPDGKLAPRHIGKLGGSVSAEDGKEAAQFCAINILALVKLAVGNLDRVMRCIKLTGFINAMPDYSAIPGVMNGASDLMVAALGDKGRHARSTVGMAVLPLDSAVEVEAMFEFA